MSGIYAYLPFGLMVLNKINNIIRDEMNKLGAAEVFLSSLQDKNIWEKTSRWDDKDVDVWFKTKLKTGVEAGLAFTHEEPLTVIMRDHISSFRNLPIFVYQIQTKFRNEIRAKSGLMRCREFLMKDLYSFCRDEKEHIAFYEKAKKSYMRIFNRVGIGKYTYITFASGGSFSKYSHEFQMISDAGEDIIYVDKKRKLAINREVLSEDVLNDLKLKKGDLEEKKAIEVGNIFSLGTKFSDPLGLYFTDEKGVKRPVIMGSYGIGPGRLMGAIVETFGEENSMLWPKEVSPFDVHLIEINPRKSKTLSKAAQTIYEDIKKSNKSALWDDRNITPGEKFADADLIGVPLRVIVSEKTLAVNKLEFKDRIKDTSKLIPIDKVVSVL
jgi:prolyl-tRNA synthetase